MRTIHSPLYFVGLDKDGLQFLLAGPFISEEDAEAKRQELEITENYKSSTRINLVVCRTTYQFEITT